MRAALLIGLVCGSSRAGQLVLGVRTEPGRDAVFGQSAELKLRLPGENRFTLHTAPSNWVTLAKIELEISLPQEAPADVQVLVNVVDWDGFWFQTLRKESLKAGVTNRVTVDVSPAADVWSPSNHHGAWHRRSLMEPQEVAVRLFGSQDYNGTCKIVSATGIPEVTASPPEIMRVRANTATPPVYGLYELRFQVSDRYANPFDPDEIAVDAQITQPDGTIVAVPAFYYQDFFRTVLASGERILPQGRPEWRLRFAPRQEGAHRVGLTAKDRFGETVSPEEEFSATPAEQPGIVRIASADTRCLEHETGQPFFPIGLNIRSPFDTRMDDQFPWRYRHPEGSAVYASYFRDMQAAGMNLVEIWASAWCFGLEWTSRQAGYHGLGQYNLIHAWERDRVFELAAEHGIYINLVLNNHGRLSTWCDPEWNDNPYNIANGGYLETPLEWFEDERALVSYEKQLRYEVARYGWSPRLFAWELWSELNLTGSKHQDRPHLDARVVAWHKRIGATLQRLDPHQHLVSTHVSNDYRMQNPDLVNLPELGLAAVDAYHNHRNPQAIIRLQRETAEFNAPFEKPVIITEFGGSPMAADLRHLRRELHAALWSSAVSTVAGAPLFWWWQVVEEENHYPLYAAFSRFMAGEDRRDPQLQQKTLKLLDSAGKEVPAKRITALLLRSTERGWGWIYTAGPAFARNDPEETPKWQGLQFLLTGAENAIYRIEFWDTREGSPIDRRDVRIRKGSALLEVPPFFSDLAFKFRRQTSEVEVDLTEK